MGNAIGRISEPRGTCQNGAVIRNTPRQPAHPHANANQAMKVRNPDAGCKDVASLVMVRVECA